MKTLLDHNPTKTPHTCIPYNGRPFRRAYTFFFCGMLICLITMNVCTHTDTQTCTAYLFYRKKNHICRPLSSSIALHSSLWETNLSGNVIHSSCKHWHSKPTAFPCVSRNYVPCSAARRGAGSRAFSGEGIAEGPMHTSREGSLFGIAAPSQSQGNRPGRFVCAHSLVERRSLRSEISIYQNRERAV